MQDFYQLFVQELKDIHSAEKQSVKMITEVIQSAKSPRLKEVLKEHLEETRAQVTRLEKIAHELHEDFSKSQSDAMQGILKEWAHVMKEHYQNDVQDAAIIGFVQKMKHYEIALYGILRSYAKHLKLPKIEQWLDTSIHEEGRADKRLTDIAEGTLFGGGINTKACKKSA